MSHHPHPHKSTRTARLTGVLLLIMLLLIITFLGVFIFQKLFYREEIAKLLPADRTLVFAEIDFDQSSPELQRFFQLTATNPYLNQPAFQKLLDTLPPQSDQFQKWFGGRIGIALITEPHSYPAPVLFLKFRDYQQMSDWRVSSLLATGKSDNSVIIGNYLVIAEHKDALNIILQSSQNQSLSLANLPAYNQLYSALPQQNLAYIYYDSAQVLASLSENPDFLDSHLTMFQQFLPFLKIFSREAIAIYTSQDSAGKITLNAQQLSLFNTSILPTPDFFNINYFYSGALEQLLPSQTIASFGGADLADQKDKLETLFANQSTVQSLLFSGSLEKFRQYVFSPSSQKIDLDKDFFGILKGNYLFSVQSQTPGKFDFSLAIEDQRAKNDIQKIQKLLLALAQNLAAQTPSKTVDITLPDGTKGREVIGTSLSPQAITETISGASVQSIAISDSWKIYFVATDNNIFVSTNTKSISDMLAKADKLSADNSYTPLISNLDHPTEYYKFDIASAVKALNMPQFEPYLIPLHQLKIGRKFTQIGVLSSYIFEQ